MGVDAGGKVKVAKGLGWQAQESELYPVGDREPFMGCKQGSDLGNHHNDP